MLLDKQSHASPYRGMPTELINSGSASSTNKESIVLYYFDGSTLKEDTGEAAGTLVVGKFKIGQIQDSIGSSLGNSKNTSLVITSTCLTNEGESTESTFEAVDSKGLNEKLKSILTNSTNGTYFIDYAKGVIYGKKADATTSLVASYKTISSLSSSIKNTSIIVRSDTELTTSYVDGTVISGAENYNQLVIYWTFTKGSLTSGEMKIEFSDDGVNYFQETFGSISSGTQSLSVGENKVLITGDYRYTTPINDKYIKISVKGTGTVTGSSSKITAVLGNS